MEYFRDVLLLSKEGSRYVQKVFSSECLERELCATFNTWPYNMATRKAAACARKDDGA